MAARLVSVIQEGGVAACPKHFVGNESETKRRFYHVKEDIEGRTMRQGFIDEKVMDERVKSVLKLIHRTRESHFKGEEKSVIHDRANSLARRVASEGIVLLKNKDHVLPLHVEEKSRIAVIGPYAVDPPIGGGGSAKVPPQYTQRPYDCLRSAVPDPSAVTDSPGMKFHVTIPAMPMTQTLSKYGKPGFAVSYFVHGDEKPVLESFHQAAMLGFLKPPLTPDTFSHFELSTNLTPLTTGKNTLAIQATSSFTLLVDGNTVLTDEMQPPPTVEDFLFVPQALERTVSVPMNA